MGRARPCWRERDSSAAQAAPAGADASRGAACGARRSDAAAARLRHGPGLKRSAFLRVPLSSDRGAARQTLVVGANRRYAPRRRALAKWP